jgi:hypothetical protein
LHDIGKVGVPDHILRKNMPFTDVERAVISRHPVVVYELLSPISYFRPALDIPYCHHEKWDGTGCPRGYLRQLIPGMHCFPIVSIIWRGWLTKPGMIPRSYQFCKDFRLP